MSNFTAHGFLLHAQHGKDLSLVGDTVVACHHFAARGPVDGRTVPRAACIASVVAGQRKLIRRLVARMVNRSGRYAAFGHPDTCIRCLCPDGKRRTVRLGLDADTAFSWPGRCSIGGKTVRGFVTGCELMGQEDRRFVPYTNQTAKGKARP